MRGQRHFLLPAPLLLRLLRMKMVKCTPTRSNALKCAQMRLYQHAPEYSTSSPSLDGDELRRVIRFLAGALPPARADS